ncbi:TolC family protein [Pseudomonas sp.]|jgi:outer membrane protein TolC|uniref:TolC family protein n=1 Tax=Pseudomonas sp. TaxID=306 RepID=UPI00272A537F|nr:TolC family protein [Pseudomonas sp.]
MNDLMLWPRARLAGLVVAMTVLAGCASLATEQAVHQVSQQSAPLTNERALRLERDAQSASLTRQRIDELLAEPLALEGAVEIALINNRGLQATLLELGIVDAERVQASRLPNPGFSIGRMTRGSEVEWERGLHLNLARLIALPMTRRIAEGQSEQTQREVALAVMRLATETRTAWYRAVAAEQSLVYSRQVLEAAEASAELARRMAAVGNYSALQQALEQSFYAEAALGLLAAERERNSSREHLTRLLGLWGRDIEFELPARLPELPHHALQLPDIEREAMVSRLDVEAARLATERMAQSLRLGRATRFINVFELELAHNSSNEEPTQRGVEITVEVPLFDWSGARLARSEAQYMQSVQRVAETAISARSQVRESYFNYRNAWDVAAHYRDEIVPLRKRISEENLLRYNGMFIGVFDLLADAREQVSTVNRYLQAQRDFWIAQAELDLVRYGPVTASPAVAAAAAPTPAKGH